MLPLGVLASARVAGGIGTTSYLYSAGLTSPPSWTFSGVPLGTEATDRYIAVTVATRDQATTAVTVGGVSCSQLVASTDGVNAVALWLGLVPTGTSATIAVANVGSSRLSIGVWSLAGYGAVSSIATATTSTNGGTATLTGVQAGDVVLAGSMTFSPGAADCGWSDATEASDFLTEHLHHSDASAVVAGTTHAVTATWTASTYGSQTAAAALRT